MENFDELQLPQSLILFCWNFAHFCNLTVSTKECSGFFFILFRSCVIDKNVKNECVETTSFLFLQIIQDIYKIENNFEDLYVDTGK